MTKVSVFFSWQSDRPPNIGRNFIEKALNRALIILKLDGEVDEALRDEIAVDMDTKGVAGSPPIVDTIFKKIDQAAVFVPDLTFAGTRAAGLPTPNANVCIEYGWALKMLGHHRIVPVMNVAFGEPKAENMPFDLRHLRNPITYNCSDGMSDEERRAQREVLAKNLARAIAAVLKSDEYKETVQPKEDRKLFVPRATASSPGRFCEPQKDIGISDTGRILLKPHALRLETGSVAWLRLMPMFVVDRTWSKAELREAMKYPKGLAVFEWAGGGLSEMRHEDGVGIYLVTGNAPEVTPAVSIAFENGEIWGVDVHLRGLAEGKAIPFMEPLFNNMLTNFTEFAERLGVPGPYRWIAGMEGLKGRGLHFPVPPGYMRIGDAPGHFIKDATIASGSHQSGEDVKASLLPFHEKVFDECGLSRSDWWKHYSQTKK